MLHVIISNLYIWIILPCFLSSMIIVKPLGSVFIAILIFLGTILIFTFPCLTCIHYNVKQRKNRNLKHSLQNFKPKTNLTLTWCMHLVLTWVMFVSFLLCLTIITGGYNVEQSARCIKATHVQLGFC